MVPLQPENRAAKAMAVWSYRHQKGRATPGAWVNLAAHQPRRAQASLVDQEAWVELAFHRHRLTIGPGTPHAGTEFS